MRSGWDIAVDSTFGGDVGGVDPAVPVDADAGVGVAVVVDEPLAGGEDGLVLDRGGDVVPAVRAGGQGGAEDREVVGLGGTGGKTISSSFLAPTRSVTWRRAVRIALAAVRPQVCGLEGLPYSLMKYGSIVSRTRSSSGVVAW